MQHIAIITSGLVGITNASLKLAKKLNSEGYRITYLSTINIREKIENQNIVYIQLPEINYGASFLKTSSIISKKRGLLEKYLYHIFHLKSQFKEGKELLSLQDYEKVLSDLKPDIALIDLELHEAILSALKLNIKTKLLNQFLFNEKRNKLPSLRTDIIPGLGFNGSYLGIELSWLKIKIKIIGRFLINKITLRNSRKSILKHYLKENKLNYLKLISRNFPSEFIYENFETLYMTLNTIEFPYKKPKTVNYIGPMVNTQRNESIIASEFMSIFNQKKTTDKKLIYCSLTTMKESGDLEFIKKIIKAVESEEKWLLIISLGSNTINHNIFKNTPKNVFTFSWVPQLEVLKNSDCSINHGGIHTINECIHFAVPMLIYSGKKFDQNGNAARITYHKLGMRGDKDSDNAIEINSKIHAVLNSELIKKNIANSNKLYNEFEKSKISLHL